MAFGRNKRGCPPGRLRRPRIIETTDIASVLIPTGFWSYTTSDDTSSRGKLSQLRALLAAELQQQIGRSPKVNIFQDVVAIPPGAEWDQQIRAAIADASFIIPIVTPGFLQSEWCCREVALFRKREESLGARSLVFPLHYVDIEHIDGTDRDQCHDADVLAFLRTRQWTDFRHLRLKSIEREDVSFSLETVARGVLKALREAVDQPRRAETYDRQKEAEVVLSARQQLATQEEHQEEHQDYETIRLAKGTRTRKEATYVGEAEKLPEQARPAGFATKRQPPAETSGTRKWRFSLKIAAVLLAFGSASLAAVVLSRSLGNNAPGADKLTQLPAAVPPAVDAPAQVSAPTPQEQPKPEAIPATPMSDAVTAYETYKAYKSYRPSSAADIEAGKATAERYEMDANAGNTEAMYRLGLLYSSGIDIPRDYDKAREWFQKGAEAGNGVAMYYLGSLYLNGEGVPKNYRKAFEWYKRAAAVGNRAGMAGLSFIYSNGFGVPKDLNEARKWGRLSRASAQ